MPPQQTNLTSETGRDAAGLALSIAALRDALSEKDAAGPPAASTRSVLSLIERYWRVFQESRRRRKLRGSLRDLSERQLVDIGVSASDIDDIAAHRAIERLRDGTAHLWLSRGVM